MRTQSLAMIRGRLVWPLVATILFSVAVSFSLGAQSIADRVSRVRDGQVRLSFALRRDVCGYGQSVWTNRSRKNSQMNWGDGHTRDVEYDQECESGPGRLVLDRQGGATVDVRFYVGGRWRPSSDATDLGTVGARPAAEFLLGLAASDDGRAGQKAIFPSTLVDSAVVWPALMKIARDETRPRKTRTDAVFWLGQLAEEPATRGLSEIVGEAALDRDVKEQAVFALSQRPKDEGVPALITIVRSNHDPEVRKKALFWLAQTRDPRALDLIEALLAKE